MSQEIKIMVRPDIGGRQSVVEVEQEFARLSESGGWKLKEVFHIGMEKSGSHNVMFVLVRETDLVVDDTVSRRGRPPKVD